MTDRIAGIEEAWINLKAKRLEVDQANSAMPKGLPLLDLKRDVAAKLELLVDYLKAMAEKDAATYADDYAVVAEIIKRLNAKPKSKPLQIEVELEDDEESSDEEPQPAVVA